MFKIGDKVKFKKSSIDTGMIDATEEDVFTVLYVLQGHMILTEMGECWNVGHFEHVKEEIMNNTEEQEIKWEVGQEVWCCAYGKGVVESVSLIDDEIHVGFNRFNNSFNYDVNGIVYGGTSRTLFFSEPKIEAEKLPPKKLFVPTLTKGDVVLIKAKEKLFGEGTVRTVCGEVDDRIYISEDRKYFLKKDIESIRILTEEIKFS